MTDQIATTVLVATAVMVGIVALDLKEVNLDCAGNSMSASLDFDVPFDGVIFAKNHYAQSHCVAFGNGSLSVTFELQLYRGLQPSCGVTRMPDHSLALTVIVSSLKKVIVEGSREIELRCHYQLDSFTITMPPPGGLQISWSNASDRLVPVVSSSGPKLERSELKPTVAMVVRDGHGLSGGQIWNAAIGQPITLDVFSRNVNDTRDFFVHDCMAFDGETTTQNNRTTQRVEVRLIDAFGCSVKHPGMSDHDLHVLTDDEGRKHAYLYLRGFQFYTTDTVKFECQIKSCGRPCQQPNCTTVIAPTPALRQRLAAEPVTDLPPTTIGEKGTATAHDNVWLDRLLQLSSAASSPTAKRRRSGQRVAVGGRGGQDDKVAATLAVQSISWQRVQMDAVAADDGERRQDPTTVVDGDATVSIIFYIVIGLLVVVCAVLIVVVVWFWRSWVEETRLLRLI